ncbi:Rha family transcriptional regulator [Aeromonas veronii]|uniref:Rha family transcriptional regulator n=1 Tax=Aeromonas TaxID=642 RepID=UPI0018F1DC6E|nr:MULTISPECIES: phage regulatory protein/antirepressor Ant [Aeromonas]MBJ7579542.1 phage regulatory protein/antirepressor Ant [Aeromonas veronii]MBS4710291.1 phage regulatory protein/antirepressor Ant [Aeromonas caviae]MEB5666933.1 phage regulatory protein/antirepressor Ant [Aeromonas veronii]HDX8425936.1 phage regulatory protein/antirepressor Ant [Aeromonas veronii]
MNTNQITMTSRQIAELTGKRHDNVMRDIRVMLDGLGLLNFEAGSYLDANGQKRPEYRLDKDLVMTLITGYDVKLHLSVVKRLRELEEAATPSLASMTPMEFIEYQYQRLKQLEAENKLMAPKAEAHDRFMFTEGSRSLRDTAKALGFGPVKFNKLLAADGYLFKQGKSWEPYVQHLEAGLFVLNVSEANGVVTKQTRVTPLGITKLSQRYTTNKEESQ